MKKQLCYGALLVAAPIVMLAGCSGGSGALTSPPSTPTATPTTASGVTSNITLGNGQRAVLTFDSLGNSASGKIQILGATAAARPKASAFNFQFQAGTYPFTGSVSANGAYSISGNFGTFGAFSMTGTLPTATTDGAYSLTVNGQTETGVVPRVGQPFPTATPTLPPVSNNYSLVPNLTFSQLTSDAELVSTALTSFNDLEDGGTLTTVSSGFQSVALNGTNGPKTGNGTRRGFFLALSSLVNITAPQPFSVGQTLSVAGLTNIAQYSEASVSGTTAKITIWRAVSGNVRITALGSNSMSVELQNLRFAPAGFSGGKGSFTVKGTLVARGLMVVNQ